MLTPLILDCEGERFRTGCMAPPIACVAFSGLGCRWLRHWTDYTDDLFRALTDPNILIVGHGVDYDMAVFAAMDPGLFPFIFQAYNADRVTDTLNREKLLDIARGRYRGYDDLDGETIKLNYSLEALAKRYLGLNLDKNTWRLRYGELRGLPLANWPDGARKYPLDDVESTEGVFTIQGKPENQPFLVDEFRQARAAFWIRLMTVWGIHTDPAGVRELARKTKQDHERIAKDLEQVGLLRPGKHVKRRASGLIEFVPGSRDTKVAKARMVQAYAALGEPVPRTDPSTKHPAGDVCLDSRACKESGDPVLSKYAEYAALSAVLNKDVPLLCAMTDEQKALYVASGCQTIPNTGGACIHSTFEPILETGRTSSKKPNIQNPKRKGGIRECFIPRAGYVFAACDYSGAELCTLGQVCLALLGRSTLAEAMNAGRDPHLMIASQILNRSYDDLKARHDQGPGPECRAEVGDCFCSYCIVDDARQTGKVANFGFPGGLGYAALVEFALSQYDVRLTLEESKKLKKAWLQTWPEMREYFAYVDWTVKKGQPIQQLFSGRFRGDLKYTARCNTLFQGLAADMAKHAGWLITQACYAEPDSPLFGCRIVNFVHDEFILEAPEHRAHEAAIELSRLMTIAARTWLPDVRCKAKPLLMRRWSKKAKALYVDGRLVPWEAPANDTKAVAKCA